MKSKKSLYILIPCVIFIWGVIAMKVLGAIDGSSDDTPQNQPLTNFVPPKHEKNNQIELNADYRDPFLDKMIVKKPVVHIPIKKVEKVQVVFPDIRFNGVLAPKTKDGKTVYFISINGTQHFFNKNQTIDQVTLKKGNSSEIIVRFKGIERTYEREQ